MKKLFLALALLTATIVYAAQGDKLIQAHDGDLNINFGDDSLSFYKKETVTGDVTEWDGSACTGVKDVRADFVRVGDLVTMTIGRGTVSVFDVISPVCSNTAGIKTSSGFIPTNYRNASLTGWQPLVSTHLKDDGTAHESVIQVLNDGTIRWYRTDGTNFDGTMSIYPTTMSWVVSE